MYSNKPNIIISKCINIENCRFDGKMINDDFLKKLGEFVNFIPVCPEVAIGLGTPRMALRSYRDNNNNLKLFQPATNTDLTEKMNNFSQKFLKSQKNMNCQNGIDGFILKTRSPSCGISDVKVYNKIDSNVSTERNGDGFFTQNIRSIYENIPMEHEGRLKNFILREEFLTKIFCLANFREIKKQKNINSLSNFQAENKYLFMAFSPLLQKKLGQIIASYNKENIEEIYEKYDIALKQLLNGELKIGKKINAFTHIFGYFKNNCSSEEKQFFLDLLDDYKNENIPTSSIINILKIWAIRDKKEYITKQSILSPFPKELIELSDSGKKINL